MIYVIVIASGTRSMTIILLPCYSLCHGLDSAAVMDEFEILEVLHEGFGLTFARRIT